MDRCPKRLPRHRPRLNTIFPYILTTLQAAVDHANTDTARGRFHYAQQVISEHINEDLSTKELAARCGLSYAHLHRLFRRYLNTTPMAYVCELRMNAAAQLLRETDAPLATLPPSVAMPTLSHFPKPLNVRWA